MVAAVTQGMDMDRRTMMLGSAAAIPLASLSSVAAPRMEAIADAAFAPATDSIGRGLIPGAVLGVVDAKGNRAVRHIGRAAIEPTPAPMRADTWFDLASVTKVVFTTTLILRLADEGRIELDAPLTTAIPDLRQYDVKGAPERKLTFRQCLGHQTHLPAVEPIYTVGRDVETLKAYVLQRAWTPGAPVYSDINFILLGIAIERLTGKPLSAQPLPAGFAYAPEPERTAATEYCHWRRRVVRGSVHDENAHALGGIAGHAGLFGTIDGVLGFARSLLDGSGISPAGMKAIRTPLAPDRSVGWQVRHPGWSGGQACSPSTIGHTGFTGTALWIDFDRGVAWSLLTNRVHPSRFRDSGITDLRQAVSTALVGAWDASAG